jgi:hypothetical protein
VKEPDGFFNFFAVMDGHNGPECGLDANDFLLEDIMDCTPHDCGLVIDMVGVQYAVRV